MPIPISEPGQAEWRALAVAGGAFLVAMVVARSSNRLARAFARWYERRTPVEDGVDTRIVTGLKRRETIVSLARTTVRYLAFGIAALVALAQLSDSTLTAVAGASLLVVLVGFAGQRFLTDILAGVLMFFEGWFAVGDTVVVEPWGLTGVVEEVSLRATVLRAVSGDLIRIGNSQIQALRVLPRAAREMQIEVFVRDERAGRAVLEEVARIVPVGPTSFVRRPWLKQVDVLDGDLIRLTAGAFVPPGREWLAHDLATSLTAERGGDEIVHGPVVTEIDAVAAARFERATSLSRLR